MKWLTRTGETGRTVLRVVLTLSVFLLARGGAHAQSVDRRGFLFGISAGGGGMLRGDGVVGDETLAILYDAGRDLPSFGFDMQIGWMIANNVAVIGIGSFDFGMESGPDVPVLLRTGDGTAVMVADDHYMFSAVLAGGVQYWLASRLWIRGGIGFGDLERDFNQTNGSLAITLARTTNFAVLAATGVEIVQRGPLAVDLQVRYSTYSVQGMRVQNVAVMAGLNFY